jgi:enamine deaminase RidA (YjgF/YER057c/UK114 family)
VGLDTRDRTLGAANAGFDTLLKTNVYLLDWDDWEAFNQIYEAHSSWLGCLDGGTDGRLTQTEQHPLEKS